MATRLYPHTFNQNFAVTPSAWSAGWGSVAGNNYTRRLTKQLLAGDIQTQFSTPTQDEAGLRFLARLKNNVSFSGTVKGQCLIVGFGTSGSAALSWAIKVLKPDGTDRGVLVAVKRNTNYVAAGTTRNRKMADGTTTPVNVASLEAFAGDYLVLELGGYIPSSGSGASPYVLADAGTDLPEDETSTAGAAWVEFTLDFELDADFGFFNSSEPVPPDNDATGVADNNTSTLVPPTGMQVGDLAVIVGQIGNAATGNMSIGNAGGQSWTLQEYANTGDNAIAVFHATFNGTWSANPTVVSGPLSGTQPFSCIMHVFRPPAPNYRWNLNNALLGKNEAAATTFTADGVTTGYPNEVVLAIYCSDDDNTWGTLSGTNWFNVGPAQLRNLAGSDQSQTWAAQIFAPSQVDGADFDGTNDYMTRGAGLTGAADSKSGIFSAWVRLDGGDGGAAYILEGTTTLGGSVARVLVAWDTALKFSFEGFNAAGTRILYIKTLQSYSSNTGWTHILASWDLAATVSHIYINDVSDQGVTTRTNDTIDYTLADWGIGSDPGGGVKLNGVLAEVYFAPGQYLDFSTASNRRKFITANGLPVNLGATGTGPTGTQPLIYQSIRDGEAVANFATNKGSGGDFSITGTLDPVTAWSRTGKFGGRFTENVSKTQLTLGADTGLTATVSWYAVAASLLPNVPQMRAVPHLVR